MPPTNRFKQNVVLFTIFLSFIVSCGASVAVVCLFWSDEQEGQPKQQSVSSPLSAEPHRLDFQGIGAGEGETHEGIVSLINHSDRKIDLLFAESSCRCSVAELPPGNIILAGEKLPMKCTLSTAGRVSDRAGGEIWIAYRFADSEEDAAPMYIRIILTAMIDPISIPE